jgi:hypothetical protein
MAFSAMRSVLPGHICQGCSDKGSGGWFGPLFDLAAEIVAEFKKSSDHAGMAFQYLIDCPA